MGRNSPDEVDEIAKKDLTALSTLLDDKPYLYGDQPTTIDATLFGTLVSLYDPPLNSKVIKPYMEQSTPNLVSYIKRIKENVGSFIFLAEIQIFSTGLITTSFVKNYWWTRRTRNITALLPPKLSNCCLKLHTSIACSFWA